MTRYSPERYRELEDLPNVGPAIARDLRRVGVRKPEGLRGRSPLRLYGNLNRATGSRHDPCVLDTFMAAVDFVNGAPERPWWKYTSKRKSLEKKSQESG